MDERIKNIYFISGLGANEKIFEKLQFDSTYKVYYIQWIEPLNNESLKNYCLRLSTQIKETKNNIIIGLSFGGIVAQELSKIAPFQKIILISSIKNYHELPIYFRVIAKSRIHHIAPYGLFKHLFLIAKWFFGTQTREEETILKSFLDQTSNAFLKWAINIILTEKHFNNSHIPLFHVHGTKDRILLYKYLKNAIPIDNGGHLAVYNKHKEVNNHIHLFVNS
jgi:pimeloyl-ACP methyl ester carboxylesterase